MYMAVVKIKILSIGANVYTILLTINHAVYKIQNYCFILLTVNKF